MLLFASVRRRSRLGCGHEADLDVRGDLSAIGRQNVLCASGSCFGEKFFRSLPGSLSTGIFSSARTVAGSERNFAAASGFEFRWFRMVDS